MNSQSIVHCRFQSPRGEGGGSDCKPTNLHGYAANSDLNFKKTFIMFHFSHPFDYILAQFF